MRKLLNLYRLDLPNALRMLVYLGKRVVRLPPTQGEKTLNEFYHQLIVSDGRLTTDSPDSFIAFFPRWNARIKIRKRPSSDFPVFRQIFADATYAPLVQAFSEKFDRTAPLDIIDAGSNIGLTSLYLSRQFPQTRFICIEPDGGNFGTLEHNLLENAVASERIRGGLWSRNAKLEIVTDFRDKNHWSIRVQESRSGSGLEAFSIKYLMDKFGLKKIDILKIDIEGSEKEVFGPDADISFLAATKCIAIEIHDEFHCREMIYRELEKYGFSHFNARELTIGINTRLV